MNRSNRALGRRPLLMLTLLGTLACSPARSIAPAVAPTPTLRALYGVARPSSVAPSRSALVLIDFQQEFFTGRLPVTDGDGAVARAAELLAWARERGLFVVHVRNVSARANSPIFRASSPTVALVPPLAPRADETMITKAAAGAFTKTDLDSLLRARGIDTVVVAGIMTHLAVDTTVRDAALLGYGVIVARDACATRPLPAVDEGRSIDAATVHRVALASLADRFAEVMTTRAIVALPVAGN